MAIMSMSSGDLPAISASSYGSTIYDGASAASGLAGNFVFGGIAQGGLSGPGFNNGVLREQQAIFDARPPLKPSNPKPKQEKPVTRRLVQVFIADPDENLPLDQGLLYSGSQKFTDATDQELFFEVDIQAILKAHNDKRVTVINKKIKDRTEYLDAAKIRDLKMVVVNVATF